MSRKDFGKLLGNVVILGMLVICLGFLISNTRTAGAGLFGGQSERRVISQTRWPSAPVRFIETKVAGNAIEFTKEFDSGDDWMRGLALTFRNTSNKNIVYAELLLQFPETTAAGPIMSFPIHYGRFPRQPGGGNFDKLLRPGEEAKIELPDTDYANLRSFLSGRSFSRVNALHIHLDSVVYDDDTGWFGGNLMRRDPNNPNMWNTISTP